MKNKTTKSDYFEKILFLLLMSKQTGLLRESEYLNAYAKLNQVQREEFQKLDHEIHHIWNFINSAYVMNVCENDGIDCIEEYHAQIACVHPKILRVARDFGLTLKRDR